MRGVRSGSARSGSARSGRPLLVELRSVLEAPSDWMQKEIWSALDEDLWRPVVDQVWDLCTRVLDRIHEEAER